jgi:hypothetical protein
MKQDADEDHQKYDRPKAHHHASLNRFREHCCGQVDRALGRDRLPVPVWMLDEHGARIYAKIETTRRRMVVQLGVRFAVPSPNLDTTFAYREAILGRPRKVRKYFQNAQA